MVDAVTVKGLVETRAEMHRVATSLVGKPMMDGIHAASLMVLRDAKINVPVDTGQLKSSLIADVKVQSNVVMGVVGSNKSYAPYVELGTKPHFPPLAALEVWAKRHGTTAVAVAKGIAAHGTKPKRYLQNAFDSNLDAIKKLIGDVVSKIVVP